MIPISSKVAKYKSLANKYCSDYKKWKNVYFANVLGKEKAFLIQNAMPVISNDLNNIYLDKNMPVRIKNNDELELIKKSNKLINKALNSNHNIGFIDKITYNEVVLEFCKNINDVFFKKEHLTNEEYYHPVNNVLHQVVGQSKSKPEFIASTPKKEFEANDYSSLNLYELKNKHLNLVANLFDEVQEDGIGNINEIIEIKLEEIKINTKQKVETTKNKVMVMD